MTHKNPPPKTIGPLKTQAPARPVATAQNPGTKTQAVDPHVVGTRPERIAIHAGKDAGEGSPHFLINKQSAVPLHIQLKEQVRYAIMSGVYEPGSPLPSIRELTAQLGIHRNTIHRVYLELQAGGLLVSRAGKGVFVADTLSDVVSHREVNAIDNLLERLFQEANQLGVNPITLGRLISQRAPGYDQRRPTVGFLECTHHQSAEFSRDLSETFGISVTQLLLDDLRRSPQGLPANLHHVVTSLFHYDEVRDLLRGQDRRVHAVTFNLHPATRKQLRELPRDHRLGFICHDANTEEIVGAEIEEYTPPGVLAGCANLETEDSALALISKVDTLIFTEAASAFALKHAGPNHELLELHFALNPTTVEKVGKAVLIQP